MSGPTDGSRPRLRDVEVLPVEWEGKQLFCLRDPSGLADKPVFLHGPGLLLASLMNGANSLRDIQAEFARRTYEIFPIEQLEALVRELDHHRMLDSAAFRRHRTRLEREFRQAPARPARHAGGAYEGRAEDLRRQIAGFFDPPEGPGWPSQPRPSRRLRGLVAPHIDFHRGGSAYGHAYGALAAGPAARRYIIFGTCHSPMSRRFALTTKDYETPLGVVRTDKAFVERLVERLPHDYFEDEFSHRGEHSVEFQAVCLSYLYGDDEDISIVPILVGPLDDVWLRRDGVGAEEVRRMVEGIRETLAEMPAETCIIAGADLAHVGRRFGDANGPTVEYLRDVERKDREYLSLVAAGDAEGTLRAIAEERDQRRVCGYPPIYLTLRCLQNSGGEILHYRQWSDAGAGAAVTFASVALF